MYLAHYQHSDLIQHLDKLGTVFEIVPDYSAIFMAHGSWSCVLARKHVKKINSLELIISLTETCWQKRMESQREGWWQQLSR